MQMKFYMAVLVILPAVFCSADTGPNPISKVIDLLNELKNKVTAEGVKEEETFTQFLDWCTDTSRETKFEIETLTSTKGKLEAQIAEQTAAIDKADSEIEELAAAIANDEAELEQATGVRKQEHAEFLSNEADLVEGLDMLDRAITVLQRELGAGASFAQFDKTNVETFIQSMSTIIEAAGVNIEDSSRLQAMIQQKATEEVEETGAPAAEVYESHSGGVIDMCEDMKEKAETDLADLRKDESSAQHKFDMLSQALNDQLTNNNKKKTETTDFRDATSEELAAAQGDLSKTTADLGAATEALANAKETCINTAKAHGESVTSRNEELAAVAKAIEIIQETVGGAVAQSYSLTELDSSSKGVAVVDLIRKLSDRQHSTNLAQLASRVSAVIKMGGDDPFAKVKALIVDMLEKLKKEQADEADKKAWCDKQLSKTNEKKDALTADIDKLTAKIDQKSAKSTSLKDKVKKLSARLVEIAAAQKKMDEIREEESMNFATAKSELELGLQGLEKAHNVLSDYYASSGALIQAGPMPVVGTHSKSSDAGSGIISILEVAQSDFAKNLAERETEEQAAIDEYEKITQSQKIETATATKEVENAESESKYLDKAVADHTDDLAGKNEQYDAVMEYLGKVNEKCVAKAETYEERKARREAEISGLKEALQILENETAFVQRGHKFLA